MGFLWDEFWHECLALQSVAIQVVNWQNMSDQYIQHYLTHKVGSDNTRQNGSVFTWCCTMAMCAILTISHWYQSVFSKIQTILKSENILQTQNWEI